MFGGAAAQTAVISNGVNICEGVADYVFLPYVGDCQKYYICVNNIPIEQSCAQGFLFNSKNQSCTTPNEANCLPNCSSTLTSFCYDRTCTKYVLCYGGTPVVSQCCDGLQYNAATDRCDYPQFVDCVDNLCSIYDEDPTDIVYIESKSSCEKYFICYDGFAEPQSCSPGLQFSMDCQCCNMPDLAQCNITTPMQRNIVPYSKKPPRAADIKCPADGAAFLPHPDASEKYYFCMNGKGVILECTPGLVFDPSKESCREPKNVKNQNNKKVTKQ